ncbi:MAG: hypothetical protein ACOX5G_11945 [Kiritimatiellia bacterium]|jgi:hypothetical protein
MNTPAVPPPAFTFRDINLGCFAIDGQGRTVATVTPQGYIDWVLVSPADDGPLIREVPCETHLCYVMGLKMLLNLPSPCGEQVALERELLDNGRSVRLSGVSRDPGDLWRGHTAATLSPNPATGRLEWAFETSLEYLGDRAIDVESLEYNNVYPGTVGRCMLFAPQKTHSSTILVDRDGVPWKFPHQHSMHYSRKIRTLRFAAGSMAGFFGEKLNPVVVVEESSFEPDWAICDMYYDLHCMCRVPRPIQPGETLFWRYRVKYLDEAESAPVTGRARHIPVAADDYRAFFYPRLSLGRNDLKNPIAIDAPEEGDCFRPAPPVKVWDRETGPAGSGSLRLSNDSPRETAWAAEPPNQVPPSTRLQLSALAKADGVTGKGIFLRLRPHRFVWRPAPHVEYGPALESEPVRGTTDWVRVATPALEVPADSQDLLVWIEVVLDGEGTAWLADVDVDLQGVFEDAPLSPVRTPVKG